MSLTSSLSHLKGKRRLEAIEQPAQITYHLLCSLIFLAAGIGLLLRTREQFIGWTFFLIGAGWTLFFIRTGWARYKFGTAYLEIDAPGAVGGRIEGRFISARPLAGSTVKASLHCWHTGAHPDAAHDRSFTTRIVWHSEQTFPLRTGASASDARISFEIPADCAPSDHPGAPGRLGHHWEMQVNIDLPGIDFERRFKVPVVKAAEK